MCMEHGLCTDEVRQLVDQVSRWNDLHGYDNGPDAVDESDDEP
jgi:hypothetical protein